MGPDDLIGGRYRLLRLLGRGGSADVWRAVDEKLGREVAVKVLRTDVSAEDRARSAGEARLLASLSHPHLVGILDASQVLASLHDDEGVSVDDHLVLELMPGGSLADALAGGPLSPDRARTVVGDVAAALDYLHGRGVIHRDVKPANVLFTADGRAKLTDFGIARVLGADGMTRTGTVIGTAAYLSPEQVRGSTPTPASDTYALGLVLLECLTGTREFPGTPAESAVARLQRMPVVPDGVDPDLAELVRAMVASEPADRPTMATVAAVLHRETTLAAAAVPVALDETGLLSALPDRPVVRPPTAPPPTAVLTLPPVQPIPAHRRRRLALLAVPIPVAVGVVALLLSSGGAGAASPATGTGTASVRAAAPTTTAPTPSATVSAQTAAVAAATSPTVATADAVVHPAAVAPAKTAAGPAAPKQGPKAPATPPGKAKKSARG